MQKSSNPYQITTASEPVLDMNVSGQLGTYRDEEKKQKAPATLQFPLDTLTEFIGNMLTCLVQIRTQLNVAADLKASSRGKINQIMKKVDKINMLALAITEDLESIKL